MDEARERARQTLSRKLSELIPPGSVDAAALGTGINRSTIYKWRQGQQQPGAIDLAVLANYLGVKASDLVGDSPLPRKVTPYERDADLRDLVDSLDALSREDREQIVRHTLWTARKAQPPQPSSLSSVIDFPSHTSDLGDFPPPPIPINEWIQKDTDLPRDLHAWVRPVDAETAAGAPRETEDILLPTTQLLNSLQEIHDERVKVVKILGDSMYPTLRNGWKVLLDPSRSLFQPGKIVMVYIRDEGTTIGVFQNGAAGYRIVKRNRRYGGPVEIPLSDGEWYPVGTVTTIVEAPVELEPYRPDDTDDGFGLLPGELNRHE